VLCLLCVVLLATQSIACASPRFGDLSLPDFGYISPYDWENLSSENGRYTYWQDNAQVSRTGIDVSEHQGSIDWAAVADDGIDFVIIRIGNRGYTEGQISVDEQFEANLAGARSHGILVGVYFFSQAIDEEEALAEADFVLEQLDGVVLDYPVVYDFEPVSDAAGRANTLSSTQRTQNAQVFCERIEAGGYTPMLYGNKRDIGRYDLAALEGYDVWYAEYGVPSPKGRFDFTIWQYANNGTVAGISKPVDMNIHFIA